MAVKFSSGGEGWSVAGGVADGIPRAHGCAANGRLSPRGPFYEQIVKKFPGRLTPCLPCFMNCDA
nr:hypothetical protein SHINE37_44546 [Rhizobiaceae bacterium]